ncbi:MAG: hypothetical protein GY795_00240 [Desulfobacterales bacterium]|nr:hypothetical protein [Desulfobacterales bacterium]
MLFVLVPMLRVGMQGVALRADIRRAKLAWQIFVPKLVDTPFSTAVSNGAACIRTSASASPGASLSPLIGAFFLKDLNTLLSDKYIAYIRYMDDILILTSARHELKRAIRIVSRTLADLQLAKHPDKTLIGRTERGFDFLGYHFSPEGLSLAEATLNRCAEHALRLYEQEPLCNREERLGEYIIRWQ